MTHKLGTNVIEITYSSAEQPFLNIFKTAALWAGNTTDSTRYASTDNAIDLDSDGYALSMSGIGPASGKTFTNVDTLTLNAIGSPYYPAGRYVVLYDGAGTLGYDFDATKNVGLSSAGRDLIDVATPSNNGIRITITAITGGNHIRNIRLVYAPTATDTVTDPNETRLANGEYFNQDFLDRITPLCPYGIRFMKWQNTVNNRFTDWADHTTLTSATWWVPPVEVMCNLCNTLGVDAWFCMPGLSTDAYVSAFATAAHSALNSDRKVYVEYFNEMWNNGAVEPGLYADIVALGYANFPSLSSNDFGAAFDYMILRAVQNGATWKSVWGADASRVIRVVAGQCGFVDRNSYILNSTASQDGGNAGNYTGFVKANVDALAVAPYFWYPPDDVDNSTLTLNGLFDEIINGGNSSGAYTTNGQPGGMTQQFIDLIEDNFALANGAGLKLLAYEGGQGLVDNTSDQRNTYLQALYAEANDDPRMATELLRLLNGWEAAGGDVFMQFTLAFNAPKYGDWGALLNITQTSSVKYDALVSWGGVSVGNPGRLSPSLALRLHA